MTEDMPPQTPVGLIGVGLMGEVYARRLIAAGFGVMVVPRGRAIRNELSIWEDSPLPKLPEVYSAILVREGGEREVIEKLADYLKEEIHVEPAG